MEPKQELFPYPALLKHAFLRVLNPQRVRQPYKETKEKPAQGESQSPYNLPFLEKDGKPLKTKTITKQNIFMDM